MRPCLGGQALSAPTPRPRWGRGNLLRSSGKVRKAAELVSAGCPTSAQWNPGRQTQGRSLTIARCKTSAPPPLQGPLSPPLSSCPFLSFFPLLVHRVTSEIWEHMLPGRRKPCCPVLVQQDYYSFLPLAVCLPYPTFPSTLPTPYLTSMEGCGSWASQYGAPRPLITSPIYLNNLAWGPSWPGPLQPHLGQDLRRHWP